MTRKSKNITTSVLLAMALLQGPYFYYFCDLSILIEPLYLIIALYLTIYLLVNIVKHRSTNSLYHIIGLVSVVIIGTCTLNDKLMEYFDFKFRKEERMGIIKQIIDNQSRPDTSRNDAVWKLRNPPLFPISKRNEVIIDENANGKVIVKFYTSLGFLDDDSRAFLYTNDLNEIKILDQRILNDIHQTYFKKLDDNWYQIVD